MVRPILYSAWFCPFAQRSWIALVHKSIDFQYQEQDPYDKTPEWLTINPRGLVPALAVGSDVVIESGIINEYVDEAWPNTKQSLLPPMTKPLERAKARVWVDFINKRLIRPFYQILQSQDEVDQVAAADELRCALKIFAENMDADGPFFLGQELGLVDIHYVPWSLRFYILEKYRDFILPSEGKEWVRLARWRDACHQHLSVQRTVQDEEKLLASYERYAKNTANSEVAHAVNDKKPLP